MLKENISMQIQVIGSEDGKETYEIRRQWNQGLGKAIIIELYPTVSIKNPMVLDISSLHLLNHSQELELGEIRIVNLYPTVFSVKPTVSRLTQSVKNLEYIKDILTAPDIAEWDIVIAWGSSLSSHDTTKHIKKTILNMIKENGLINQTKHIVTPFLDTEKQLGTHPLYLGLRHGSEKWDLDAYPVLSDFGEGGEQEKNKKGAKIKKKASGSNEVKKCEEV